MTEPVRPSLKQVLSDWFVSLSEYLPKVMHKVWTLVVAGVGAVLGIVSLVLPPTRRDSAFLRPWVWVPLLILGLLVGQFTTFNEVRKERDHERTITAGEANSVRFGLTLEGFTGERRKVIQPPAGQICDTVYGCSLQLGNACAHPLEWEVVDLSVVLDGGQTAQAGLTYGSTTGIIWPGRVRNFTYHPIWAPIDPPTNGSAEYKIRYGPPAGKRIFERRHKLRFFWATQDAGNTYFLQYQDDGNIEDLVL